MVQERILAWVKACELRIALVKIVEKCSSIFLLMVCFCTCCEGTFVLLPKDVFVGIWLFLFYSLGFVKFEELVTVGQSLLRISIVFWRGLRA